MRMHASGMHMHTIGMHMHTLYMRTHTFAQKPKFVPVVFPFVLFIYYSLYLT